MMTTMLIIVITIFIKMFVYKIIFLGVFFRETDGVRTALVITHVGAPMKMKQRTSMEEAATNFIHIHPVGKLSH